MVIVIQRVTKASVKTDGVTTGTIDKGLLVLAGIAGDDTQADLDWMAKKIANLRIFNDAEGKMNLSVKDSGGDILVVSQFTLHASTKKGNRPSFTEAAPASVAIPLYEDFLNTLEKEMGKAIPTGRFGADMQVTLENDGPVTIIIDSKNRK
jgi:D-tyrosyl-tRNA(Tyr) deacylase